MRMSQRTLGLVVALGGVAAGCGLGGVGLGGPGFPAVAAARAVNASPPAHLLVYAQEWSLWPSRTRLAAGTIDVQLWNRGQDSHDVRVRRRSASGVMVGSVLAGVSITPSGDIHDAVWHLQAGRYELYCSLPGHLMMGMHANFTVTG
jgi:plastocyanin